jgi:hypothetical protein
LAGWVVGGPRTSNAKPSAEAKAWRRRADQRRAAAPHRAATGERRTRPCAAWRQGEGAAGAPPLGGDLAVLGPEDRRELRRLRREGRPPV